MADEQESGVSSSSLVELPAKSSRRPLSRLSRSLIAVTCGTISAAIVYILLSPGPIDAVAYIPPPIPEWTGNLEPNDALQAAESLAIGQFRGPEDVAVDSSGRLYVGNEDGTILRGDAEGMEWESFAHTGGRPLGLAFDADGNLIVADGLRGLLSIRPQGEVHTLLTEVDGFPLRLADDVDIAPDGRIYFSDASRKFPLDEIMLDMLEGRPHGRLICYDPETQRATTLLDDLYFANGVAVDPNGEFVLVSETYRYRIRRYWLTGPRTGTVDVFADNLPGFPDGVSASGRGTFWVAIFTPRNPTADRLAEWPTVRNQLAKLPGGALPAPQPYGLVLELDQQGTLLRSLHDPLAQQFDHITSAQEQDGYLYLGNLTGDRFHRLRLP